MAPICGAAVAYPTRAIGTSGRPSVLCISTCPAARQETNNPEERPDEIWLALPPGDGSQPEFATTSSTHTHCRFFSGVAAAHRSSDHDLSLADGF